jgi:hypothetical protein
VSRNCPLRVRLASTAPLRYRNKPGAYCDFIDDHWRQVASKEALWLFFGLFGFGREVEGYEVIVREEPSKGRSLAGLAGPSQHDHRTGPSGPLQAWLNIPWYPHLLNMRYERIFCTSL